MKLTTKSSQITTNKKYQISKIITVSISHSCSLPFSLKSQLLLPASLILALSTGFLRSKSIIIQSHLKTLIWTEDDQLMYSFVLFSFDYDLCRCVFDFLFSFLLFCFLSVGCVWGPLGLLLDSILAGRWALKDLK